MEQGKINPRNGLRALIDELYSRMSRVGSSQAQLSALGNYVSLIDQQAADTANHPLNYTFAAIVVRPMASGIFRVDFSANWVDATAGENVTWQILAVSAANPPDPITITGGGGSVAAIGSAADATSQGQVSAAIGVPLTISNISAGKVMDSKTLWSLGSGEFQAVSMGGLFHSNGNSLPKVPFTLGVDCVFFATVTAAGGPFSGLVTLLSVQEQPLP